ncbi:MAG: aldo/keto reductase [Desulfobacterales bacterium]|nr:aldo/keto reductase [Desulfobacterales bacterium]
MRYNRVGNTDLMLSVVGMGTAQLRYVPRQQAIDTLCKGFDLGINWLHTAVDYDGAEAIIAKAIERSGCDNIHVASNAPGPVDEYKSAFESTCRIFGKGRLSLFGVAGIDYCEDVGHNIWESGGVIEFLRQMKRENRLDAIYCSTHGAPQYVEKLITSDCFDAIMIAHNPLGFHVLSYYGKPENKEYEELLANETRLFPLAEKHNVSLLIMKPLAGGLLCRGKAFPERKWFSDYELNAGDVLRAIIQVPGVCAVVPGTASVEEARENAMAGYADAEITTEKYITIRRTAEKMRAELCSRCGDCEETCSQNLRISWLFREGYIWNYPADAFEALTRLHYFKLHPQAELICHTCENKTCRCSNGIDIPGSLAQIHDSMMALRKAKLMHPLQEELDVMYIDGDIPARIIIKDIPQELKPGRKHTCRIWFENVGGIHWASFETQPDTETAVGLIVKFNRRKIHTLPLYHDVPHGMRTYFAFELEAPAEDGKYPLNLSLVNLTRKNEEKGGTLLLKGHLHVPDKAGAKPWMLLWKYIKQKFMS